MNHVAAGKVKKIGDSRAEKKLGEGIDKVIGVVNIKHVLARSEQRKVDNNRDFLGPLQWCN